MSKAVSGFSSIKNSLEITRTVEYRNFFQSINSKNTCKTSALGMGGQKSGMTNEVGKFPEICNESIQAQLTDLQQAIPLELFRTGYVLQSPRQRITGYLNCNTIARLKAKLFLLLFFGIICLFSCQKPGLPLPPTAASSRYPNVTETDRGLAIVWFEPVQEGHALKWSEFNGRMWSNPVIITSGKDYFINWADFPSVFYNGNSHFVVHWLEKNGSGPYDYDVKVVQSHDRGRSWSAPIIPHRDEKKGEHGFVSFFKVNDNEIGLVWLDGRNMLAEGHEVGYGQMTLYSTTLDKDGGLGKEILLDDRVCECCPTSAIEIGNEILVAYRDRSLSEIRNINLVRWDGGAWKKPQPLHDDNWKIAGCPVNGPKLAVQGNNVASVWYTSPHEQSSIYISISNDGGDNFNAPVRLDSGKPIGRVDCIWLDRDRVLVSWMEMGAESTNVMFSTVSSAGQKSRSMIATQISPGRASGHPVISRYRQHIFLAWTEVGEVDEIRSKWIQVN